MTNVLDFWSGVDFSPEVSAAEVAAGVVDDDVAPDELETTGALAGAVTVGAVEGLAAAADACFVPGATFGANLHCPASRECSRSPPIDRRER